MLNLTKAPSDEVVNNVTTVDTATIDKNLEEAVEAEAILPKNRIGRN